MNSTVTSAAGNDARRRRAGSAAQVVGASNLPAALGNLVLEVSGKCRLWGTERADVARELCAHFRDGLEAGVSESALASSFGDPSHAARLITATRRKLRPSWWRASRATLRAVGVLLALCVVGYGVLAARFFLFSPKIAHNFVAELNVPVLETPESERAWPLYVEARIAFGKLPAFMVDGRGGDPLEPGDANWDKMTDWLDGHADAMTVVREGAGKPVLGFVLRAGMDPDLARAMEQTIDGYTFDASHEPTTENPMMIGVLLPHLGEMRRLARWLSADARLAASRGDALRFQADVRAMLGMGEQLLGEPFILSTLVGVAVADLAVRVALETDASFLNDDHLRNLAHRLASFGGGRVSIDASTELMTIEDILQRFFSDDGDGDGHFVGGPEGDRLYSDWGLPRPRGLPLLKAMQPVQSVLIPSRAEIRERAERYVAAAAADDAMPPWRHADRRSGEAYEELMNSGIYTVFPALESLLSENEDGPVMHGFASRDMFETRRAAALTVLAMESFRRKTGAWPATLDDLVPAFLPAVPRDPFDGRPLRYLPSRSEGQRPVLYSIGVDGVDDAGRVPETEGGRFGVHNPHWLRKAQSPAKMTGAEQHSYAASHGDWVLWPEPPEIVKPPEPATDSDDAGIQ